MLRKLVKTTVIEVDDHLYHVRYLELKTVRGMRRYSAEVLLGPDDRIIFDDDSMSGLESKVDRLMPATIYSRLLAGRPPVAA